MSGYSSATCMPISGKAQPRRLSRTEVKYLVFEGGGGKGFAYLGALEVLEELKIMEQIKGFAGSSAGAITALLLSMGYTGKQLKEYMSNSERFTSFFDPPTPRYRPRVYKYEKIEEMSTDEIKNRQTLYAIAGGLLGLGTIFSIFIDKKYQENLLIKIKENRSKPPFNYLLDLSNLIDYLTFLGIDMGLFHGLNARWEFARVIAESDPRFEQKKREIAEYETESIKKIWGDIYSEPRDIYKELGNMTFREHYEIFKKELLITGSNLSFGKTILFSHKTTGDFPVADAVRISMSLPFIYKPYVIKESKPNWPPCGTYVDGGLWNNLPYREFDGRSDDDSGTNKTATDIATLAGIPYLAKPRTKTLGLRLEFTPFVRVEKFSQFLTQVATFGVFGSGETQVLSQHEEQMILLDTRGLGLLDFNPDPKIAEKVTKRSRRATLDYFNVPVTSLTAEEKEDDRMTEYLRKETRPYETLLCD